MMKERVKKMNNVSNTIKPTNIRLRKIHHDIIADYMEQNHTYTRKQDVVRHAITLLEKELQQNSVKYEMEEMNKKIDEMRIQIDELISLNVKVILSIGTNSKGENIDE